MKARRPAGKKDWFRVENAFKDDENASDEKTAVYIYDEIGESWFGGTPADDFVQMLSTIKSKEIELHLNSPGGAVFDGVAIYNALRVHPAKVTVVVDALAASAASFIAMAGDEIIMTDAAMMMIHDGSAFAYGPAAVMRQTADVLDQISDSVASIYAKRAGQSKEFWRNLMIEEVWYSAEDAVSAGLADRIGDPTTPEDDAAAQNKWDLSVFAYAGRKAAPNPFEVHQRIANQLKEITVADSADDPKKETGSPETDPNAQTTEGTSSEADKEKEEQTNPAGGPEATPPAPEPENKQVGQPQNSNTGTQTFTFTVNGQPTTDMAAVQARLDMLEQFRNETLNEARKDFVKQLAADNKIGAPQIDKLTAYALSLNDEGYAAWKATYDDAAPLAMLSYKGGSGDGGSAETNPAFAEAEQCKEIVQQHKLGKMSNEQIMQTQSYKRLMELDPTFKL